MEDYDPTEAKKASKGKAARDSTPDLNNELKFTSIPGPMAMLNGKNVAGNFARTDKQTWWAVCRKNEEEYERERSGKRQRLNPNEEERETAIKVDQPPPPAASEAEWDGNPASRTLVFHPGSRFLRVGRASDDLPVTIPNVVARRRTNPTIPSPSFPPSLDRIDPTLDPKIEALRGDLRNRFRAYKLNPEKDGSAQAKAYNATATTAEITEDPKVDQIAWTVTEPFKQLDAAPGEYALRLRDPTVEGWELRWPIEKGTFNTRGYASINEVLGDVLVTWQQAVVDVLKIPWRSMKDFSAILVIPDLFDQNYLREMAQLMLEVIGFKQICFQQESMCGSFGTGLSTCAIVDMGARTTSISCVEEGMIVPESRMSLDLGGDDITELLYQLLARIDFPYREANLNRTYDRVLYEFLKENICVLSEGDVALNLYHFDVRRPGKPLLKSSLRVFDEVILAPLCLYGPKVVEFERKQATKPNLYPRAADIDNMLEMGGDAITQAMRMCTRHLAPLLPTKTDHGNTEDPRYAVIPPATPSTPQPLSGVPPATPNGATEVHVDLAKEAAKTPLDVAVFETICSVGNEDRMKKLCNNIVLLGGTSRIHNAGFALQSRLAILFASRFPGLVSALNIVPPPLNFDPRTVIWKGASLLGKLDSVNDLWIRQGDWDALGARAIKERTLCCL